MAQHATRATTACDATCYSSPTRAERSSRQQCRPPGGRVAVTWASKWAFRNWGNVIWAHFCRVVQLCFGSETVTHALAALPKLTMVCCVTGRTVCHMSKMKPWEEPLERLLVGDEARRQKPLESTETAQGWPLACHSLPI